MGLGTILEGVVITAPGYVGNVKIKNELDNQHNSEFAERLARDSRFENPIRFLIGKYEPVELIMFTRKK